jgi:tetrahydromethanopterin S-methyltransferase subunit B
MAVPHSVRTATAYGAVAGTAILALAALNIAADRLPFKGLHALRNYVTGTKG